ncbi:hypothetical protein [Neorhodopirellula lusitana]|uniref:hypothetical protein n=1 Tax=Neorhodopirellula lusitana TaxID=445327 RepID=UPI00384F88E4
MKYLVHLFLLSLVVVTLGCAEEKPERTYDVSDVEQLLIDHPELAESPRTDYRQND